eukprot:TRINITY_DN11120_c0_g1_i1.p2 TRINITY_DN11120_c0_g1~~TRINITY_DN11120_c0_g1_i1.p2  ORF type:complete len:138 (-),score=25.90 TRINITY_DN11120_c0_g1_i1:359-772(-)
MAGTDKSMDGTAFTSQPGGGPHTHPQPGQPESFSEWLAAGRTVKEIEDCCGQRKCVRSWYSYRSTNALLSIRSINTILALFSINGVLAMFCVNSGFSVLSLNSFFCLGSLNSFMSVGSINSAFALGCSQAAFKVCLG